MNTIGRTAIAGVTIISSPAEGDTYGAGEQIDVKVRFAHAPAFLVKNDVGNVDQYATIGIGYETNGIRLLNHVSGDGTRSVTFRYTVQAEDVDRNGIHLPRQYLTLQQGSFTRTINGPGRADDPQHKVDGGPAAPPVQLEAVRFDRTADFNNTHAFDEIIRVRLIFTEAVSIATDQSLTLQIGDDQVQAPLYMTWWQENNLGGSSRVHVFAYKVADGDEDTDGVEVLSNTVTVTFTSDDEDYQISPTQPPGKGNHKVNGNWHVQNIELVDTNSVTGRDHIKVTLSHPTYFSMQTGDTSDTAMRIRYRHYDGSATPISSNNYLAYIDVGASCGQDVHTYKLNSAVPEFISGEDILTLWAKQFYGWKSGSAGTDSCTSSGTRQNDSHPTVIFE